MAWNGTNETYGTKQEKHSERNTRNYATELIKRNIQNGTEQEKHKEQNKRNIRNETEQEKHTERTRTRET